MVKRTYDRVLPLNWENCLAELESAWYLGTEVVIDERRKSVKLHLSHRGFLDWDMVLPVRKYLPIDSGIN